MTKPGYTLEPLTFDSNVINHYLDSMVNLHINTYRTRTKMSFFPGFAQSIYQQDGDSLVDSIKLAKLDVYKVLIAYPRPKAS